MRYRATLATLLVVLFAGCAGGGARSVPVGTSSTSQASGSFAIPAAISRAIPPKPPAMIPKQPSGALRAGTVTNTAHTGFFAGEASLGGGAYYLSFPNGNIFGYYSYLTDTNYIYHFDMGYEYVVDANDGNGGAYLYDFASGHWWYTSHTYAFPYIYDFTLQATIYYFADGARAGHYTTSPRYFYNFATGHTMVLPVETINPLGFASPGGGHGGGQCAPGSGGNGCPSVYALSSDVNGIAVTRIDPSNQNAVPTVNMTTPANDPLPDSSTNVEYRFGSGATPFTVTVQQIHDGPHQVYYNSRADSSGTVDATSLQSIGRHPNGTRIAAAAPSGERIVRRLPRKSARATTASDRLYVRFRASALQSKGRSVADAVRTLGTTGEELRTVKPDPLTVVRVPAGTSVDAFRASLLARSEVAAVYPVRRRYALSRPQTNVNDTHFRIPDQWYLMATGAPYGWSYANGSAATIAVIDTGVDLTNADLASRVVFSESVISGQRSSSETDSDGHGTNVAGIAAATTNNSVGFAGASNNANLIAIGIFDAQNNAFGSDEALAISDALAHNADVISLSLGAEESTVPAYEGYDQGEYEAVEAAIAAGTVVVAAAGNNRDGLDTVGDGYRHNNLDYPAQYPGVIAVGATMLNDNDSGTYVGSSEHVTAYSQAGDGLGLVAPGGEPNNSDNTGTNPLHWIWNYYSSTVASPNNCLHPSPATSCTAFFAGTSQATPQVSAAAALLISAAGGHHSLTPAQVAQLLESTADNINDPYQGHGRLNVYRAMAALVQDPGATATGPQLLNHAASQTIAFAYNNGGQNRPGILNYDYPAGVPVAANGTFRIADVRPGDASSWKVGVWYDANGNGVIDAGDYFGSTGSTICTATAPCAIGTIKLNLVGANFTLP